MIQISPAPAVDWNEVFLGLRREGYTMHDVAGLVGIPRSTLMSWRSGAEPRHQDGETVIKFWSEVMDKPREALPEASNVFTSHLAAARRV